MLLALARWILRNEAPATQKGRSEQFVTPEELSTALKKFDERLEFEFGEWYDKFSALHARAEKRAQRDNKRTAVNQGATVPHHEHATSSNGVRPSVLAHRKPWSV